ncbi:MAG: phosphoribosylanthranilate isomerase [Candidatus Latescibacteria bacterium]|jgi:phosphoribosylanthranilate isomerase|nr:phosphoribosylanthranilate isomerase [Candidatus Latescibacterota bacterium]
MTIRVKICGITNSDDALCAAGEGADAVGFIFYARSPRFVRAEAAAAIIEALPPFVTPVGVFVNEPRDRIADTVATASLRAIQLHGDEPPEACEGYPVPVVKALRVGEGFDPSTLGDYPVKTFLMDTEKKELYGGTGETFDWSVAGEAARRARIVLSGGLTPENVAEAIGTVGPYAVDCGSGVEAEPGRKDHGKIARFMEAVRGAER